MEVDFVSREGIVALSLVIHVRQAIGNSIIKSLETDVV